MNTCVSSFTLTDLKSIDTSIKYYFQKPGMFENFLKQCCHIKILIFCYIFKNRKQLYGTITLLEIQINNNHNQQMNENVIENKWCKEETKT